MLWYANLRNQVSQSGRGYVAVTAAMAVLHVISHNCQFWLKHPSQSQSQCRPSVQASSQSTISFHVDARPGSCSAKIRSGRGGFRGVCVRICRWQTQLVHGTCVLGQALVCHGVGSLLRCLLAHRQQQHHNPTFRYILFFFWLPFVAAIQHRQ